METQSIRVTLTASANADAAHRESFPRRILTAMSSEPGPVTFAGILAQAIAAFSDPEPAPTSARPPPPLAHSPPPA